MFTEPVNHILYCYGIYQAELFEKMEREMAHLELHKGIPSVEKIHELTNYQQGVIVVLDDLQHQVIQNQDMSLLFTQGTHHLKCTVIYLSQRLFPQGKHSRDIFLNTAYTVAFGNIKNTSQLSHFARQMFPGKSKLMVDAFVDATAEPYSYLVIDTTPQCPPHLRLRTHIFPHEDVILYSI